MTKIQNGKITRNGMAWPVTVLPRQVREQIAEVGADLVADVLTKGDYYPPMIDSHESQEIEDRCIELFVARSYIMRPAMRPAMQPGLERLGYTAAEAVENSSVD